MTKSEESIKSLKIEIAKLKRQLYNLNKQYRGERLANRQILNANTRLFDENKWLKRDVERIKNTLKYIDSCKENKDICSVKVIRDMLVGINKEDLDDYVDV